MQEQINRILAKCAGIKPLVVISCITYNHEQYLRDALDGFVKQKTNFPFVAIVHDDASTDGTADVLSEYSERYPDTIIPIYETENQYSKHDGSLNRIMTDACAATGAKYIALCEGDDYWTDPLKLQKQVDFLESHPDYSMCFANAIEHWQNGTYHDKIFSNIEHRDYQQIELLQNWIVPTATVVYRSIINSDANRIRLLASGKIIAGDIVLFLTCYNYGKVHGFADIFSVYRRLRSGVVMSEIDKYPYKFMIHEMTLGAHFKGDVLKYAKKRAGQRFVCELKKFKDTRKIKIKYLFRAFSYAPITCIKTFFKYIW